MIQFINKIYQATVIFNMTARQGAVKLAKSILQVLGDSIHIVFQDLIRPKFYLEILEKVQGQVSDKQIKHFQSLPPLKLVNEMVSFLATEFGCEVGTRGADVVRGSVESIKQLLKVLLRLTKGKLRKVKKSERGSSKKILQPIQQQKVASAQRGQKRKKSLKPIKKKIDKKLKQNIPTTAQAEVIQKKVNEVESKKDSSKEQYSKLNLLVRNPEGKNLQDLSLEVFSRTRDATLRNTSRELHFNIHQDYQQKEKYLMRQYKDIIFQAKNMHSKRQKEMAQRDKINKLDIKTEAIHDKKLQVEYINIQKSYQFRLRDAQYRYLQRIKRNTFIIERDRKIHQRKQLKQATRLKKIELQKQRMSFYNNAEKIKNQMQEEMTQMNSSFMFVMKSQRRQTKRQRIEQEKMNRKVLESIYGLKPEQEKKLMDLETDGVEEFVRRMFQRKKV